MVGSTSKKFKEIKNILDDINFQDKELEKDFVRGEFGVSPEIYESTKEVYNNQLNYIEQNYITESEKKLLENKTPREREKYLESILDDTYAPKNPISYVGGVLSSVFGDAIQGAKELGIGITEAAVAGSHVIAATKGRDAALLKGDYKEAEQWGEIATDSDAALDLGRKVGTKVNRKIFNINEKIQTAIASTPAGQRFISDIYNQIDPGFEYDVETGTYEGYVFPNVQESGDIASWMVPFAWFTKTKKVKKALEKAPEYLQDFAKTKKGKAFLNQLKKETKLDVFDGAKITAQGTAVGTLIDNSSNLSQSSEMAEMVLGENSKIVDALTALHRNPDDPLLLNISKEYLDNILMDASIAGTIFASSKTGQEVDKAYPNSPREARNAKMAILRTVIPMVNKAIDTEDMIEQGALEIPEPDRENDFGFINLKPEIDDNGTLIQKGEMMQFIKPVQAGVIGDTVGWLNTKAGKAFGRKGAVPTEELRKAYIAMKEGADAIEYKINEDVNKLKQIVKDNDLNEEAVNLYLTNSFSRKYSKQLFGTDVLDQLEPLRRNIDNNTDTIAKLLGIDPNSKLGVAFKKNKGVYLTQSYTAYTNPKWSRNLTKALKGKRDENGNLLVDPLKPNSAKTAKIINDARDYLKSLPGNKQYTDDQIDLILEDILNPAKNKDIGFFDDFISDNFGSKAQRIFKEKKGVPEPIGALLGRVDDPIESYRQTIRNQQTAILKADYLNKIKMFMDESTQLNSIIQEFNIPESVAKKLKQGIDMSKLSVDELNTIPLEARTAIEDMPNTVPLGGLLKRVRGKQEGFVRGPAGGADKINLADLERDILGPLGTEGESLFGLDEYFVSKEFFDVMSHGIDSFGFKKGYWWQRPIAWTQAVETVYDTGAYGLQLQGLIMQLGANGHLFNPRTFKNSKKTTLAFMNKIKQSDPASVALLEKLKRKGLLDSSITKRNIEDNYGEIEKLSGNLKDSEGFMSLPERLAQSTGRGIDKTQKGISTAYGALDDLGKLLAYHNELDAYRTALKPFDGIITEFGIPDDIAKKLKKGEELTPQEFNSLPTDAVNRIKIAEEELEDYAIDIVTNTFPSYSQASPIVRNVLGRLPFGNYATYPAEVLRTQPKIAWIGLSDMVKGSATGNPALFMTGARRVGAQLGTIGGMYYAIDNENQDMGWTDNNIQVIQLTGPEWLGNSKPMAITPFYEDPETGEIIAEYYNTGLMNAFQTVSGPLERFYAMAMNGEQFTETDFNEAILSSFYDVFGAYVGEKRFVETLKKVGAGIDENGRPFYTGKNITEDLALAAEEIGMLVSPGTIPNFVDFTDAEAAEQLDNLQKDREQVNALGIKNLPRNEKGYPVRPEHKINKMQGIQKGIWTSKSIGPYFNNELKEIKFQDRKFINSLTNYDAGFITTLDDLIIPISMDAMAYAADERYAMPEDIAQKVNEGVQLSNADLDRLNPTQVKIISKIEENKNEIREELNKVQEYRNKHGIRISDGVKRYTNLSYFDKNNKPKTLGLEGVLNSIQNDKTVQFKLTRDEVLLYGADTLPALLSPNGLANFNVNLENKGFPEEFIDELSNAISVPQEIKIEKEGEFDVVLVDPETNNSLPSDAAIEDIRATLRKYDDYKDMSNEDLDNIINEKVLRRRNPGIPFFGGDKDQYDVLRWKRTREQTR